MNFPLPEADAATAAEVRDWLDRFAVCVREVDYAAARPFWHPDIVIFGTYQELVKSLSGWTEQQWDKVWPRTAEPNRSLFRPLGATANTSRCWKRQWICIAPVSHLISRR